MNSIPSSTVLSSLKLNSTPVRLPLKSRLNLKVLPRNQQIKVLLSQPRQPSLSPSLPRSPRPSAIQPALSAPTSPRVPSLPPGVFRAQSARPAPFPKPPASPSVVRPLNPQAGMSARSRVSLL